MDSVNKQADVIGLITRVRQNDQQAFLDLIGMYKPLLDASVARVMGNELAKLHEDDLRQEATVVFYNAILNYDLEQKDVEFGLYARICISNALVSQLRLIEKRRTEELTDGQDDIVSASQYDDPTGHIVEQERLDALYAVIRKNLSDYEYGIWKYYMAGKTAKDIGHIVGRDERSVANAVYRIRRKLRRLLSDFFE